MHEDPAVQQAIQNFLERLREKTDPEERDFHRAVEDVVAAAMPLVLDDKRMQDDAILERLVEPDRSVLFRVPWEDDKGKIHIERGYRVQFNRALGPYKGGLRFHPTVNLGTFKFLGFEQTLKNSLTGLPLGAGKGGSTFDTKGRSRREVMRFCQSFMTELCRHIGEDTDVPAGDQGVGAQEVAFLFGQYTRLLNRWAGVLTGKSEQAGGSKLRPEATGYGCVYFLQHMLERKGLGLKNQSVVISGSGNVALFAAEKIIEEGGRLLALSDSNGFVHFEEGMQPEQLARVRSLKNNNRGRLSPLSEEPGFDYYDKRSVWTIPCAIALPCATQNEMDDDAARTLVNNGVQAIAEGANLPLTTGAMSAVRESKVLYGPGKAANAGGVAVSGFEMSQNAERQSWGLELVNDRLRSVMKDIHKRCVEHGATSGDEIDYERGANRAGFLRVAHAMLDQGVT